MKILLYTCLFISFPILSQIKIVDKITKEPIPFVYLISEKGDVLDVSDVNGVCNVSALKEGLIELSHISYQKKNITFKKLQKIKVIELEESPNTLDEVIIEGNKRDYLVIKAYFRSYQLDNDIPKSFMDGIVEYFIPTKGSVKINVIENRTFRNDSIYNAKIKKKRFLIGTSATSGDITGPLYLDNKNILTGLKLDDNKIFRDDELIGKIQPNKLNNTVDVVIDFTTPKSKYSKSLFGVKTDFINHSIKEVYTIKENFWNGKANLSYKTQYRKNLLYSKRNTSKVKVESYHEIYALEKKYISKKEFKSYSTSSFFGTRKSSYKDKFWKDKKLKNIPKLPIFIKSQLNTKLIEY